MKSCDSVGIGVDSVSVDRIRRAHNHWGERFLRKIFANEEISYCFSKSNPYPSLAARFAGKEAVSKAIGHGIGARISFRSILVVHDANGAPKIQFAAHNCINDETFIISLSHTDEYAIAYVLRLSLPI
jgi:holo-[acyl-carrier protein] synthase